MKPPKTSPKFAVPGLVNNHLARPTLLKLLDTPVQLKLVSAPSGYGKSYLVSNWAEAHHESLLWISLESEDNGFLSFCETLLQGLRLKWPNHAFESQLLLKSSQSPDTASLIRNVINDLLDLPALTLVLDDYHMISDESVHALLMNLIELPKSNIQIVLISRSDPPFPLAHYRAQGRMTEIRIKDLELNPEEVEKMLAHTVEASDTLVKDVASLTEGWMSGLKLLIYGAKSAEDLKNKISNSDQLAQGSFQSLVKLFLSSQKEEFRKCILLASHLKVFSAELLDFALNISYSKEILDELLESNVFVISLDPAGDQYRFHHLFQECLQVESENQFAEEEIREVMKRTGEWYREQNILEEALHYLVQSESFDQSLDVFIELRVSLINGRNWVSLRGAHELMENRKNHIVMQLTEAWLMINEGRTMEMFDLIEDISNNLGRWRQDPNFKFYLGELNALLPYKSYNIDQDYVECIKQCELAFEHLNKDFIYPRGYAWIFLVGSYQIIGELKKAEKVAFEGIKQAKSSMEESHIWFVLCFIYWFECDLEKVEISAQKLLKLSKEHDNKEALANASFFMAMASYVQGDWKRSRKYVDQTLDHGRHTIGIIRIHATLIRSGILEKTGALGKMESVLKDLKGEVFVQGNPFMHHFTLGWHLEMLLCQSDLKNTEHLLSELSDLIAIPITNFTDPRIGQLKARVYLGDDEKAIRGDLDLLKQLLSKTHNRRFQIEAYCIEALLEYKLGNPAAAEDSLKEALRLAEYFSIVSPFIDSGPLMEELIKTLDLREFDRVWIDQIMAGFHQRKTIQLDIHISEREMDILRLMTEQLSNQEIGERLFISEKTVKNHSNSLFKKLGVKNRREAAHKAKDLELVKISTEEG